MILCDSCLSGNLDKALSHLLMLLKLIPESIWIGLVAASVAAVDAAAAVAAVAALVTDVLATAYVARPAVFAAGDFLVTASVARPAGDFLVIASVARVWGYQYRPTRGLLGDPSVRLCDP